MATKPWGIGAWAAEAELAEEEEKAAAAAAAAAAAMAPPPPDTSFPSLAEASRHRAPQKKKKQTTLSLAEFTIGQPIAQGTGSRHSSSASYRSNISAGLTLEEMVMLPSGPRDRSGEEERRGLGGGFRDYGADRYSAYPRERESSGFLKDRERDTGGFLKDRERNEPSRADDSRDWGSSKRTAFPTTGAYESEKRYSSSSRLIPPERVEIAPSRADEADNWGLAKRSLPIAPPPVRRPAFESAEISHLSRADEADSWAKTKKPLTQPPHPLPGGTPAAIDLGSHIHSRADEADNWISSKKSTQSEETSDATGQIRERKPIVLAPASHAHLPVEVTNLPIEGTEVVVDLPPPLKPKPNPFGSARPREAVLADRGIDQQLSDTVLKDSGTSGLSRPSSSGHSSRPLTPETSMESSGKSSRPKVNPFGDAKPREVLLQERGQDWRKMDLELEHRSVDRPETEEERILKEEIKTLKQEAEEANKQRANGTEETMDGDNSNQASIFEVELQKKEKELEELVRALDDKVRFSQRVVPMDRPGSRSGRSEFGRSFDMVERSGSLPGSRPGSRSGSRPGSQSGRSDTGQNYNISSDSQSIRRLSSHSLWSRSRQVVESASRSNEAFERTGSWVGSNDIRQSFDSLQRSQREVGAGNNSNFSAHPRGTGPDIWTRSNEGPRDRKGSWGEQQQLNDRVGNRRF